MNYKYLMINGLAFSEELDMKKLKKYAKHGWILDGITAGLFYKLRRDTPKNIEYSLDYQSEADEEYFKIFSEANWTKVVSISNVMHIFWAPEGTKPIYSDRESEIDKYERMKSIMGKGSVLSLLATVAFVIFSSFNQPLFFVLSIISMIVFIFYFMPYVAYKYRLRLLKK